MGAPVEQAPFVPLRFESAALPAERQFPTFASAMVNFAVSREQEGAFAASARIWRIGALVLTEVTADPVTYDRDLARIAADQIDHLYVNLHLRGGVRVDTGTGLRAAEAGSLLVIDMRQPCRMHAGTRRAISLAVPRHLLLPRLQPFDPHGLIATAGLVPLLAALLQATCAKLPVTPAAHQAAIERLILGLLADTLLDALRSAEAISLREEALLARLRAYLDAHLAENLDVATICRDLGVSRSGLYRVCGEGGVLRLLQQRRLRRLRALLQDPGEMRPIAQLAESTGFADKSHASRAFRQAYGLSPAAFRETRLCEPRPVTAGNEAAQLFGTWVRDVT